MPRSPFPSGWYSDVAQPGRQRFWDGASWSEETRSVPEHGLATHRNATIGKRLWCAINTSPEFAPAWAGLRMILLCIAILGLLVTAFRIYEHPGAPTGPEPAVIGDSSELEFMDR